MKKDFRIRLDDDLHEWLKAEFPHGFMQSFLEECIVNLRTIIEEGRIPPPSEYSRRATIETIASLTRPESEKETDARHPGEVRASTKTS